MRTLQRHHHTRPLAGANLNEAAQSLGPQVRAHEWRVWRMRLKFLLTFFLIPGVLIAAFRWYWGLRVTAEGLVANTSVVLTAPAPVRVAEVHCHEGQKLQAGDLLLRLEARSRHEERRVLECLVEQRRLRLRLGEQGGALLETDPGRRGDLLEEARDEQARAAGDHHVAVAELDRLVTIRESRALALVQEQLRREGDLDVLSERVREAEARSGDAQAGESLAGTVLDTRARLHREGDVSPLDLKASETGHDAAAEQLRATDANVRALRKEIETTSRIDTLARQQDPLTLSELDAQIEAQRQRVNAVLALRDLWEKIVARRAQLSPKENTAELHQLQLDLFRSELREAETQLLALDVRLGNVSVRAESSGIVDQLFVQAGQLVDQGQPLATCFDPSAQWAIAYLPPDEAARIGRGQTCRIQVENLGAELNGRVARVSRTWVPCPDLIRHADDYDLRVPVRIECDDVRDRTRLWPGARFRVLFEPRPSERSIP